MPAEALRPLPRSFYRRSTRLVARELLGATIVRKAGRKTLTGTIVETEAYLGRHDPASHAYRGRTRRNEAMFLEGGHLYVYFTYGMHYCANVVTEKEGVGHAVLIRAVEPLAGEEEMRRRRNGVTKREALANGPAKFCQAFGIGREENGTDLCGSEIYICRGKKVPASKVASSPRIGIRQAAEKPWRYYLKESGFISRRPSTPVRRGGTLR